MNTLIPPVEPLKGAEARRMRERLSEKTPSKMKKICYKTTDQVLYIIGLGDFSHLINPFSYTRTYPHK